MEFGEATGRWFEDTFERPTPVQERGWGAISQGKHALLLAPTGSGKTLAAFLWAIDRLTKKPRDAVAGVRVLYVSPLKALVYDIERNLRTPLSGISRRAEQLGLSLHVPGVDLRTGDTTPKERRRQAKRPADILVTTPESLYLILGSNARETLRSVETVIVDEVHALAATKRGAHLVLSLERLSHLTDAEPQRVGLSATARPATQVARFLGGDRPVDIIDTSATPAIDVTIEVPVEDMTRPQLEHGTDRGNAGQGDTEQDGLAATIEAATSNAAPTNAVTSDAIRSDAGTGSVTDSVLPEEGHLGDDHEDEDLLGGLPGGSILGADSEPSAEQHGMWPAITPRLLALIRSHQTTILFVNSRGLCERLAGQLNELAEEGLVRAHHGSVAHEKRSEIEEALKAGELRGIVATSSLELGVDMGTVDLVLMVESPGAVARGLQRIGRAGHQVGEVSKGVVLPKHRGDLLEATVVVKEMEQGAIEPLSILRNPLDVLSQQVVAACALDSWQLDDLFALIRRAANYHELPKSAFVAVLDMLSGRYPSNEFADLRPRLNWDRENDTLTGRPGSKALAAISGGTIPDRGLYGVYLGAEGPRLGELDEEMVHETTVGQTFTLGASTWRVAEITRDRVIVDPAPGEPGKLPFWHGDGPGRPVPLGEKLGEMVARVGEQPEGAAKAWLQADYNLDALAAQNLVRYVAEQKETTGTLPTNRAITVERFRDELGDWRVCILSPFGARVHAPWALSLSARLGTQAGFDIQTMWSDDGIVLTLADGDEPPELDQLLPDPEEVEDLVVEQLESSALFASQFRENAARALLLPRRRPGARSPLWQQRLRAQKLLAVARQHPSFPIVIETYRSCLTDVFDVPALQSLLRRVRDREVRIDEVETASASPFARSLVFAYVAAYLYAGDAPLAERKAQALSLDRKLLRELLGSEELRELLDADVIAQVEDELQALLPDRKAQHPDALHDLLRRIGDLTIAEIEARSAGSPEKWIDALVRARRIAPLRLAKEQRYIAVEDVAAYRDGLGAAPPAGVPRVFLEAQEQPFEALLLRYARNRGPFLAAEFANRYALPIGQVSAALRALEGEQKLLRGAFQPGVEGEEWCHPDVLTRIKRRTLAKLRNQVAPVECEALGRFLPVWHGVWHGVGEASIARGRLDDAVGQLEGLPLSYAELENTILPARVAGFSPRMLDELGALGSIVWVGCGALGPEDGRIALYRRDRVALLREATDPADLPTGPVHQALLTHLRSRGASFFQELVTASGVASKEALDALWDLVWAGAVTNDTFQALRALRGRHRIRGRRQRQGALGLLAGGRWSLVEHLVSPDTSATERSHALAVTLLERHGVVSRECATLEAIPGGFTAVYKVLRAMEEAGKVRRGYFVEGLGGAQFAFAGAVDRLRAVAEAQKEPQVVVLAASDPANPYGWLLPWPARSIDDDPTPRRVSGASVVLVNGNPALYLDRGGKRLRTFKGTERQDLVLAASALRQVARRRRGRLLRIEKIDGEAARSSKQAAVFRDAAFSADHRGLVLEAG